MENKAKAEINGFAVAALVFGILSLLTGISMFLPVINCTLAVVFSLLSRGNRKMCGMAVTGMALGIAGLLIGLFLAWVLISWLCQVLQSPEISNTVKTILKNFFLFHGTGRGL